MNKVKEKFAKKVVLEISYKLGGLFAALGYTAEEAEKAGHEVIDFIGKYEAKE